jgi:hypothetical protein
MNIQCILFYYNRYYIETNNKKKGKRKKEKKGKKNTHTQTRSKNSNIKKELKKTIGDFGFHQPTCLLLFWYSIKSS